MYGSRVRWRLFAMAGAFVLTIEWLTHATKSPYGIAFWLLILLGGIFVFTCEVLRRLDQLQERIRQESGRFAAVFETAGLGVVLVGPDCMVTAINDSAEALCGRRRDQVVGRLACSELINRPGSGPHACAGLCARATVAGADETALRAAFLQHPSGQPIPITVSSSALPGSGGGRALVLWDSTEQANLEVETQLRKRQVEGLMEIGRVIGAYPDLRRNMDQILDRACEIFGMDLVAWGVMEDGTPSIAWRAARGLGSEALTGTVQPLQGVVMGRVLLSGRPFFTQNLAGQVGGPFSDPPMHAAMAVPLRIRETGYGVLFCASAEPVDLTEVDVKFFTHLASYITTAVENAQLMEQVQHIAALEERQRLAREMHDSFGQVLTYLGLRHHLLAQLAAEGKTEAILEELERLNRAVQETHVEVRQAIFQLKESGQPRASMQDRWRQILLDFEERTGIRTEFEVGDGVPGRLPEKAQLQLTRIVQEALTNVRNHSGALTVAVRLTADQRELTLQIADDGSGFETAAVGALEGHHFGLTIMRERAEAIGATLEIRSMRGSGTTVTARMPLAQREGIA